MSCNISQAYADQLLLSGPRMAESPSSLLQKALARVVKRSQRRTVIEQQCQQEPYTASQQVYS